MNKEAPPTHQEALALFRKGAFLAAGLKTLATICKDENSFSLFSRTDFFMLLIELHDKANEIQEWLRRVESWLHIALEDQRISEEFERWLQAEAGTQKES